MEGVRRGMDAGNRDKCREEGWIQGRRMDAGMMDKEGKREGGRKDGW